MSRVLKNPGAHPFARDSMMQEHITHEQTNEIRKSLTHLWDALLAQSGVVAYLPIIVVTIVMFCGASWQMFWLNTDAARYQCYALTFWLGGHAANLLPPAQCAFLHGAALVQPPFQLLPIEYPPLTLGLFSLGLFAPLPYYQVFFALLMALTSVLIYWLLLRYGPRGAAFTFALYLLIGAWATAEGRFDLVPAALTLLCIIAAERKHWTSAYIALAIGVLLKLFPLLLLPALFIAEQHDVQHLHIPLKSVPLRAALTAPAELWHALRGARNWRWRNSLIFCGIVLGVTGFFALLNFQGALVSQLSYFTDRPVQVEATGSTLLWLGSQFGFPGHIVFSYGSINIESVLGSGISLLFEILFVLGYIYTMWKQWNGKLDVLQASIAILLVFISTGKVFSPQYLIWVMPLIAYSGALNRIWILSWGAISLLTTIIYPFLYTRTLDTLAIPLIPGFIQTVSLRNALFALLTLAYLFNWFQIRRRKALPPLLMGNKAILDRYAYFPGFYTKEKGLPSQ